jgi:hypothetical protein
MLEGQAMISKKGVVKASVCNPTSDWRDNVNRQPAHAVPSS